MTLLFAIQSSSLRAYEEYRLRPQMIFGVSPVLRRMAVFAKARVLHHGAVREDRNCKGITGIFVG